MILDEGKLPSGDQVIVSADHLCDGFCIRMVCRCVFGCRYYGSCVRFNRPFIYSADGVSGIVYQECNLRMW